MAWRDPWENKPSGGAGVKRRSRSEVGQALRPIAGNGQASTSAPGVDQFGRKLLPPPRRRRRRRWYQRPLIMFPLFVLLIFSIALGVLWFWPTLDPVTGRDETFGQQFYQTWRNAMDPEYALNMSFPGTRQLTVLLVGLDHVKERGIPDDDILHRADSVLVASTDFDTKQARLISIPRDGWVLHVDGGVEEGWDKLGHTYVFGQEAYPDDPAGGIRRTQGTVENLLRQSIPYYVVINFDGFIKLIDALGGISVDVEKNMKYTDRAGDLHIDLKKGVQRLTGEQAMGYARFRHDALGDIGRMGRQQQVIKAVLEEMKQPANTAQLPRLAFLLHDSVQTNLSLDQLSALAQTYKDYDPAAIQSQTVQSYGSHDPQWPGSLPGGGYSSAQYMYPEDVDKAIAFLEDLSPPPPPPPVEGEVSGEAVESEDDGQKPASE